MAITGFQPTFFTLTAIGAFDTSIYFVITCADVGALPRLLLLCCNQLCTESLVMKVLLLLVGVDRLVMCFGRLWMLKATP
jgi:hypothetical protein